MVNHMRHTSGHTEIAEVTTPSKQQVLFCVSLVATHAESTLHVHHAEHTRVKMSLKIRLKLRKRQQKKQKLNNFNFAKL